MKVNMPVTDREVMMKEGAILVTETDPKGIITKANEAFIEISGFSEKELVGSNHNIIRHPDMPSEVFADFWKTIKKGNPWVGIIKNRTKNGDYYWVEANVMPIYKNGRLVSFMSCRYAPTREQIQEAEILYDKIKRKQASLGADNWKEKLNIFKKMSFTQKMRLSSLFLLLTIAGLMGVLYLEKQRDIGFVMQERVGSDYLKPVKDLQVSMMQHRGLDMLLKLNGELDVVKDIVETEVKIDQDISAIEAMESHYGIVFKSSPLWQSIQQDWHLLRANKQNLSAEQSFNKHTALIQNILNLMKTVAKQSNLMLDARSDSHYLMNLQVQQLPALMAALSSLRDYGIRTLKKAEISRHDIIQLAILRHDVKRMQSMIEQNTKSMVPKSSKLLTYEQQIDSEIQHFLQQVTRLQQGKDAQLTASGLFSEGSQIISHSSLLYDRVANNLHRLLQMKIDQLQHGLWLIFCIVLLVVVLAGMILWGLNTYFYQNINRISRVLSQLINGKFHNTFDFSANDEFGALLKTLQRMQVKMNVDLAASQDHAITVGRIKQALDNVQSCVMVTNNKYDIIYMNKTVLQLFQAAEADIQKQLPNFEADALLGSNIDNFHKNPSHQRRILDNLTGTLHSTLTISNHTMDLLAAPILDENGDRQGIVVEWRDRSEEVLVEQEIANIIESVKSGYLDKRIDISNKDGFFAKLGASINELANIIDQAFTDVNQMIHSLAQGHLDHRIETDYSGIYLECKNNINSTIDKLNEVVNKINEAADFISHSSQEIASGNNNLSQRAEQQAANLEQTASSMEQLTSTVKNNADNAQQANQLAEEAKKLAESGGKVVKQAIAAMQEINDSSSKIADIINVIDEIAFQTNLLALNASVEAARAGEQGRGFSVVATEVRNLAQRSAKAAQESKELIQGSVEKVRCGSEFVFETGNALNDIEVGIIKVGDIVSEIAAASAEQSIGITQVNQAITKMDEITQQNAALAEEASAASMSMYDHSKAMMQLLAFFKIGKITQNQDELTARQHNNSAEISFAQVVRSNPVTQNPVVNPSDDDWEEF